MTSRRRLALARTASGLVVALAASGCAGSGASARETFSPPPDSPVAAAPSGPGRDAVAAAEEDVRTAYMRYWETVVRVGRDPDPHAPALAEVATGATLRAIKNSFAVDRVKGWVSRGHVEHAVSSVTVDLDADPPTATLQDCVDGSGWQLYEKETGKRVPSPEGLLPQTTTFVWREGHWLVSETLAGERGHC